MSTLSTTQPQLDERAVLQPNSNRMPCPLPTDGKAIIPTQATISCHSPRSSASISPPASVKLQSARHVNQNGYHPNSPSATVHQSRSKPTKVTPVIANKSTTSDEILSNLSSSSSSEEITSSIAAVRRAQLKYSHSQRKMRTAHYGRTSTLLQQMVVSSDSHGANNSTEKRCNFITPCSDPLLVRYHDEEWGVPVHDDRMLFELLVLTGAQVGSDWTSILRRRDEFRSAFADFDIQAVANYSHRKAAALVADYGMDMSHVRGAVENASRILQVRKEFVSFDAYLWGFVNNKPIATQYRSSQKIPRKTSKSESMSKDMIRRGFRFVGPTVMHSFMQSAGLTNDHIITCPRHSQCVALASHPPALLSGALRRSSWREEEPSVAGSVNACWEPRDF